MIDKNDLAEITNMLLTVQKEMMSEMAKMFLSIEKEHFKENELWICKGRRLQMTNIVNHMKICLKSIDKDVKRKVSTGSVLNTTIGAMKSLVEVCEDELKTNPNLIAGELAEKDGTAGDGSGAVVTEVKAVEPEKIGVRTKKRAEKAAKRSTAAVG